MGQTTKARNTSVKNFTKIALQEQSMYIRIEAVIPAGPGQNSADEIEEAVTEAVEYLRNEGCAEVTEAYMVEESSSDACQILYQRRRDGDMQLEFHGI
jgi:hypothetical protein